MTLYVQELLCIDAVTGDASLAYLTVEDDDDGLFSQEAGAVYTLDGTVMAANPVVETGLVDLTFADGSQRQSAVLSFQDGGNRYYFVNPDIPADNVAAATNYVMFGISQGITYTSYGATLPETPRPYQGQAFVQDFGPGGGLNSEGIGTVTVFDDDARIDLIAEDGATALGHVGYNGQEGPFSPSSGYPITGIGDTNLRLVTASYDGPNGAGSFQAIEYTLDRYGTVHVALIPLSGAVDLADVGTITGVTLLAGSLDGVRYTDYGLNFATTVATGTNRADTLSGTWLHDEFTGKNGADLLVGSSGEDRLYGGGGGDRLYGGMHADTLDGGAGDDTGYGRSYDDNLTGGDGADSLYGGWGADTLDGGKTADSLDGDKDNDLISGGNGADSLLGSEGNDALDGGGDADDLRGGTGDDTLTDGTGGDTLTGNNGADVFVFGVDAATDRIDDFKDGTDLIDLTVVFKKLTITDVAPGEVHVTHSGETLIILDTTGTLTAADLTRDDFI